MNVPLYKRILSFIYPVRLKKSSSTDNPVLELLLYRNQVQLATDDALYSDGRRYRPLLAAYNVIKDYLPSVNNVLLLGSGIGSGVQIMKGLGYNPMFTIVDRDEVILKMAEEVLGKRGKQYRYRTACRDAATFVDDVGEKYDVLIVDIFSGRDVPAFVYEKIFLLKCLRAINPGGKFILNYIINDPDKWDEMLDAVRHTFPHHQVLKFDINRVVVATV